jgi:hypothetical protein
MGNSHLLFQKHHSELKKTESAEHQKTIPKRQVKEKNF